jgi:ribosomal protein S18 acetylase RimI-like enzyme
LRQVLADLTGSEIRQVAHQVEDLGSIAALFLQANGFYVEHEEWLLALGRLQDLPQPAKRGMAVVTFPRSQAISHFAGLYRSSFTGRPWDQPFTEPEIAAMLADASDILFVIADGRPVGFAWLHFLEDATGLIEPLGILPAYQGQRYGRFLLLSALNELARRGASMAQIGAWRNNDAAIRLYQSLGFTHQQTITYLARDLPG